MKKIMENMEENMGNKETHKTEGNFISKADNNNTASLFLMALLLICITSGLIRGIKMEPRNSKKQQTTINSEK